LRNSLRIGTAALACAAVLASIGGCASRRLAEGTVPFPAKNPVLADAAGRPLNDLPASKEPLRLILLDFPWCPPCSDAWASIAAVSKTVPAGKVRVYRVLFDREKLETARGASETPPLLPPPALPALAFPVTTVTALTAPFLERYKIDRAPVLLLADASGRVLKRWIGYSPALTESLRSEIAARLK
jgi:hypothetical protein